MVHLKKMKDGSQKSNVTTESSFTTNKQLISALLRHNSRVSPPLALQLARLTGSMWGLDSCLDIIILYRSTPKHGLDSLLSAGRDGVCLSTGPGGAAGSKFCPKPKAPEKDARLPASSNVSLRVNGH